MTAFITSNNQMTIMLNGTDYTISQGTMMFNRVMNALKDKKSNDEIEKIIKRTTSLDEYLKDNNTVTYSNGEIKYNGEVLHNSLAERVKRFAEQDYPIEHLLKFIENIQKNPSYNSRNQLYNFLEHQNLVIDDTGYILGYKSVQPDYTDWHTGKFSNVPGSILEMERNDVDDSPTHHCSTGFHFGSIQYVKSFGGAGSKIVIVRVNPADVVGVPNDYSCQKCRTCRYEVVCDYKGEFTEPLYKSTGESYVHEDDFQDWDDVADDNYDDDYDDYEEGDVLNWNDSEDDWTDEDEDEEDDETNDFEPLTKL